INSSLPSEIDDFINNILENKKVLTSLFIEVTINKARELLISDLNNVDNDSENTDWDTGSTLTIASRSTEAEDEIIISQTSGSNLTSCQMAPSIKRKKILETLFAFDAMPPDATINSVLKTLLTYWDD
ncbi:7125_t:CDS:2, partial [Funneliformis caledonium]